MLDVNGGPDVDTCVEKFEDIFVAFAVLAAGNVGVGQLVNDCDLWMTREDRVDVHLFQFNAAVGNDAQRNNFQVADLVCGFLTAVRLNEADHDVDALFALEMGIAEHVVGFADAGSGAEIDARWAGSCWRSSWISAMASPPRRDAGMAAATATGKVNRNVVPWPRRLSTAIWPPRVSTSRRTSARPIPVPLSEKGLKRSKMLARRSASMPRPLSRTVNCTNSFISSAASRISPSCGV